MADPTPNPTPDPAGGTPNPAPGGTPNPNPDPNPGGSPNPNPDPGGNPTPADEFAFLPEKYRVTGADGKLDLKASSQKLADGYANASKRIGSGDMPPEKPDAYTFTMPEAFKDVPMDEGLSNAFRERAHAAGFTQKQYEFAMGEYFQLVPSLLNAKAKFTADQATAELSKVWGDETAVKANKAAAEKAVGLMPADLQERIKDQYATDPVFWQFAAHFGKEAGEDKSLAPAGGASVPTDVQALMASDAYRNPKNPEHAAVSEKVRQHFEKTAGTARVF